jgi:hypothetical protein
MVNNNPIYVSSKAVPMPKFYTMKKYMRVKVKLHEILISALAGGMWSASHTGCLMPGKEPPVLTE